MSNVQKVMGIMRVPFLILTPACVMLGVGMAYWATGTINYVAALLALAGAVMSHISVNAFNEYLDFKSGLDAKTEKTPFSGGSGTLPQFPEMDSAALATGTITLLLTTLIGVYFVFTVGWELLPLGLAGVFSLYAYTKWFTKNPVLSLISPGLGFGPFMVMGTYFVLTGEYTLNVFLASLVPFFLVNNLLLLNQFPDVEADKTIGRNHFPILIGKEKSAVIYAAFMFFAYLVIILSVVAGYLPMLVLLGLVTALLAIPVIRGALKHHDAIPKLIPFMGLNVMINIFTPLLMALGLFLS